MNQYKQRDILGDVEPGKRVRSVVDRLRNSNSNRPDMSQATSMLPDVDEMGPRAAGRTPAVGSIRRERGIPVVRDQVPELLD